MQLTLMLIINMLFVFNFLREMSARLKTMIAITTTNYVNIMIKASKLL